MFGEQKSSMKRSRGNGCNQSRHLVMIHEMIQYENSSCSYYILWISRLCYFESLSRIFFYATCWFKIHQLILPSRISKTSQTMQRFSKFNISSEGSKMTHCTVVVKQDSSLCDIDCFQKSYPNVTLMKAREYFHLKDGRDFLSHFLSGLLTLCCLKLMHNDSPSCYSYERHYHQKDS